MSSRELGIIRETFAECFKDVRILERSDFDGQFFETNDILKEKKRWLVVAAGIDHSEAQELFRGIPKRAEKAIAPLKHLTYSTCEFSMLFVLRPFNGDLKSMPQTTLVTPFAPHQGISWVEIRKAYIRILNLPNNDNGLNILRWEWDVTPSLEAPFEKWLRKWKNDCGFNPAHPPSHLHINSHSDQLERPVDTTNELRLAIGRPNPLALILSIAVWLKNLKLE